MPDPTSPPGEGAAREARVPGPGVARAHDDGRGPADHPLHVVVGDAAVPVLGPAVWPVQGAHFTSLPLPSQLSDGMDEWMDRCLKNIGMHMANTMPGFGGSIVDVRY